jgi:hypothetical protein
MAKIEGTQNIPSEWLDLYRGTLTQKQPDGVVRSRYPYRVPKMQEGGKGVSPAQLAQRARFKQAIGQFKTLTGAQRQRWYENEPPWGSFLWYYDYFILSALMGDANAQQGGHGVIKSIQMVKQSVPTTGGSSFSIDTVDPNKTVVMLYGNSYISDLIQRGANVVSNNSYVDIGLSPNIDTDIAEVSINGEGGREEISEGSGDGAWGKPYVDTLSASNLRVRLQDLGRTMSINFSWEIIEHKSQTIYPVITSIGANAIGIDWAKEPSVAADVSIIVIEYI